MGFWDDVHARGDRQWLTMTPPAYAYDLLRVGDDLRGEPKSVLEIGAGNLDSCRHLLNLGHRVTVVDIAEKVLREAEKLGAAASTPAGLERLSSASVDLAISLLTFQHISDTDLASMLAQVFRLLRPRGVCAFQFAELPRVEAAPHFAVLKNHIDRGILFFRSAECMRGIVAGAGGRIVAEYPTKDYPEEWNIRWHFFRCTRGD